MIALLQAVRFVYPRPDITQTRFYQEVLEIGEKKGLQQGVQQREANFTIRLLKRRCGNLTAIQEQKAKSAFA